MHLCTWVGLRKVYPKPVPTWQSTRSQYLSRVVSYTDPRGMVVPESLYLRDNPNAVNTWVELYLIQTPGEPWYPRPVPAQQSYTPLVYHNKRTRSTPLGPKTIVLPCTIKQSDEYSHSSRLTKTERSYQEYPLIPRESLKPLHQSPPPLTIYVYRSRSRFLRIYKIQE